MQSKRRKDIVTEPEKPVVAQSLGRKALTPITVLAATVCAVLWAGQSVAVKFSMVSFEPRFVILLRILLSCLVVGTWAFVNRISLRLNRRQFVLISVNAVFLYTQIGLYTVGTDRTDSVRSILLINTFPFFTVIVCHFFLPDFPFSRRVTAGLLFAFFGVTLVFNEGIFRPETSNWSGDVLVVAAAAVIGAKIAYVKVLLRTLSPTLIVFWGAALATPLFLCLNLSHESPLRQEIGIPSVVAVLYQGIVVSGFTVLLWGWLLSQHSPNDLNAFRLATPLLGVFLGWLLLSEPLSIYLICGGLLVVLGCYLVTKKAAKDRTT